MINAKPQVIVIMGVSGCGKSTVAKAYAEYQAHVFIDADDYHSADCKEQMSRGIGLSDEQRAPWLQRVCHAVSAQLADGKGVVLACSALKRRYRQTLRTLGSVYFVLLALPKDELIRRLLARENHFVDTALLDSQLATLEPPTAESDAVIVDAQAPVERLVQQIAERVKHAN